MSTEFKFDMELLAPEQRLIISIIKSGIEEHDVDYINSNSFGYHCELVGLDYVKLQELIHRMWRRVR